MLLQEHFESSRAPHVRAVLRQSELLSASVPLTKGSSPIPRVRRRSTSGTEVSD